MEHLAPWCSWCRLCAKEDAQNHVNIQLSGNYQPLTPSEDVKFTLKEALKKYFWVQSCEDLLPKHLCLDCYSLISSIMLFNERVERVQQMYKFLVENPIFDSCDLKAVRIKFNVPNGNRDEWCNQKETRELDSENIQNKKKSCRAERLTVRIKQEYCGIESNLSEYEENNDVDNGSINQEEMLYDEEHIVNTSQEEDEDPFDAMSEDGEHNREITSSEGEEKIEPKATTRKRACKRNKQNNDSNTGRAFKHKRRRRDFGDINCKKKKNTTEDFVLDVACRECGHKFDLYSTYCDHIKESHSNDITDKHWKCPLCDRTLQTWYNFERHMRIHMPLESRKTIKCPECENRYTSSAQLDAHITYKHKNEKPFICEECGICVRTNSNLRQHMLIHTDNAPFECEVCKKKFKNNSRLKIHMDIHSPNKHVCAICGLQLNSRATLNRHFLVHTDEMQHKCDYCGRAFKRAKALKNHLILHTGLKPYSCDFCDRTFANGSNCRSHMKKMHPEELASLEASGNKTHTKNIPKLEALKAVTKAADNLTPVVTKFSGCFAFGKKPKISAESVTPKNPKCLQKSKKIYALQARKKSTSPLDLQNIPPVGDATMNHSATSTIATNFKETTVNSPEPSSIPNFDNIYQHLMKHSSNELHIKKPPSSQSSPVNINSSLIPQQKPLYSYLHQTNVMTSNTLAVSQESENLLLSPESHNSSMTPLPTIDHHSNTSPSHAPYYDNMRQPLPHGTFM